MKIKLAIALLVASLWALMGITFYPETTQTPGSTIEILSVGGDPTGVSDNSTAFNTALNTAITKYKGPVKIHFSCGVYHFNKTVTISPSTFPYNINISADKGCVFADINTDMDPTALGVFVIPAPTGSPVLDAQIVIEGFTFIFHQPTDLVIQTNASSATGTNSIQVANASGVVPGMYVCDAIQGGNNPSCKDNTIPANFTQAQTDDTPGATVGSVTGSGPYTINLNNGTIESLGVGNGDFIHFAGTRAQATPLSGPCSLTAGSPPCAYPYAIYNNGMRGVVIRDIQLEGDWDGFYMGANDQNWTIKDINDSAMDVGIYMGQDSNFSQIINYRKWDGYGWKIPGLSPRGPNGGIALVQNYYDSLTRCLDVEGQVSGLVGVAVQCWNSKVIINSANSYGEFYGLQMDGTYSVLTLQNSAPTGWSFIGSYHTSGNSMQTQGGVNISGGVFRFIDFSDIDCGAFVPIQITGGFAKFDGGKFQNCTHNGPLSMVNVTGGYAEFNGVINDMKNSGTPANGFYAQSSTGILNVHGNTFLNDVTTGLAIQFNADNSGNNDCNNVWNGWTVGNTTAGNGPTALGNYCAANVFPPQGNACYLITQIAIPMVDPGSGTMSTNGAFTIPAIVGSFNYSLTASGLPVYIHLPANAIDGSTNASLWYFAYMTSATAGTVYHQSFANPNPVPKIPASPTPWVVGSAPGAWTDTTTHNSAIGTVPPNALGLNGRIRMRAAFTMTSDGNNKLIKPNYAGTSYGTITATTTNLAGLDCTIQEVGVTNGQNGSCFESGATSTAVSQTSFVTDTTDTTLSNTAGFSVDTTNSADVITQAHASIEICPY